MSVLAAVLLGVAGAELVALVVLGVLLVRSRRNVAQLQADAQARLAGGRWLGGRAVRAMVETAARVRDQGVGGMLMSSLEELTRWSSEDRAGIARIAAPDGTITIFFSDIEDSTPLNEKLGDAAWVRLLGAHDRLVRGCVERHAGHVVKTQGDGFMIVFSSPDEAVRAAIGIQSGLSDGHSRQLRRAGVRIRIGVHAGRAVTRDGDYFGRNVAMTARIAAHASGGEILVSDEVRTALDEDQFALEPRGEVELKGLADRHALWAVNWGERS